MFRTRVLVFLILYVLKICDEVNGGCTLSLQKDLGDPSPVYLHNGGFLAPSNASGTILLRRSETIRVACPGDKRFIVLGKHPMEFDFFDVKCVKETTFRGVKSPWVGNFSEVTCNVVPWFTVEEVGSCFRGYKLYRVGYKIDNAFYTTYEACFNKDLLHTAYVKHELQLKATITQPGRRPLFREGDLFGKVKMSQVYTNQSNRIREVFGDKKLEEYVNKKQFLSRGHLAPRADFPLYPAQRASFHYVNSAPQWMRGNAGDWAALEDVSIRF
ncbi:unnamed protein product [Euphydryas editha]|uniref:DNA/RNA non-specific endonuclease/pyrophosphatase/phosphodiesterase domain-containing protein n=1 Tax=Euphydryas editha TaxID=104508 RepID=A0AAU9UUD0_EUPED|nr:unnamed protein product [Euphydryas editha]